MHTTYKTSGTCSTQIDFDIDEQRKIRNIRFTGGCSGNTQGVSKLAEGMDAEKVMNITKGILCGSKPTSCPDQLSKAISVALRKVRK